MATLTVNQPLTHHYTYTAPYGNATERTHQLVTNDKGIAQNSNEKAAIEAGDVVILGELPEGFCMTDATVFVMKGFTGAASLGFEYADGIDHPDVPQDDKYFFEDKVIADAARIRADGSKLYVLPKPANLILTCAAANTKASELRVVVNGELVGAN